jgi:hypothetical protein
MLWLVNMPKSDKTDKMVIWKQQLFDAQNKQYVMLF